MMYSTPLWIQVITILMWIASGGYLACLLIGWIVIKQRTVLPYAWWGILSSLCLVVLYGIMLLSFLVPELIRELFDDGQVKYYMLAMFSLFFIGILLNTLGFIRLTLTVQPPGEKPVGGDVF